MAFDPSYSEILKNQKEVLKELDKLIKIAEAKAVQGAADIATKMLRALNRDHLVEKMMTKITSYAGVKGKQAGKEFAAQFHAQTANTIGAMSKVSAIAANLDKRALALSERMTRGYGQAAKIAKMVQDAGKEIDKQIDKNNRLAQTIQHQMTKKDKHGKYVFDKSERNDLQKRLDLLQKTNAELLIFKDNSAGLAASHRRAEILEKMQGWKEKMMAPIAKARDAGGFAVDVVKTFIESPKLFLGVIAAAIFGFLALMVSQFVAAGKVFRETGQTAGQLFDSTLQASALSGHMLKQGFVMPAKEAAEQVAALQDSLGQLTVPDQILNQAAYLNKMFKMSAADSAGLVTMLYRLNGRDGDQTIKTLKYVEGFARANKLNGRQVFEEMAKHGNDLAESGNAVAEAMARAAVDAKRLGYNMSSMTNLANRLVDDFEGALQTQAKLATMFPGADMSEVMYASQFGTIEDVTESVKSLVQSIGMDFKTMPRSFKQALSQATGLSATELMNINGAKGDPRLADDASFKQDVMTPAFDIITGGLPIIIDLLKTIAFTLAGFIFGPIRKLTEWVGGMFGGVTPSASATVQGAIRHAGGMIDGSGPFKMMQLPRFHGGLLPNEIPAILQKGEAVLTAKMMTGLSDVIGGVMAVGDELNDAGSVKSAAHANNMGSDSEIIALLRQILVATKEGKSVTMDGKKVGNALMNAYR